MHFGNFTKSGHHRSVFGVEDASVLDKQRVMPGVISALDPSVAVAGVLKTKRSRRFQIPSQALVKFKFEPVDTPVIDGVFKSRVFAIGSITEIALNLDDFLGNLERLVLGADSQSHRPGADRFPFRRASCSSRRRR